MEFLIHPQLLFHKQVKLIPFAPLPLILSIPFRLQQGHAAIPGVFQMGGPLLLVREQQLLLLRPAIKA
jgi:hypothetical protein